MPLITDNERVAHLLRRFGFGASEAEIEFYGRDGWKGAVDRLLDFDRDEGLEWDVQRFANEQGQLNVRAVQAFWYIRILVTQRPLEQKLTLFWHDHFATSAEKVSAPLAMHEHIDTLRRNGHGRFLDLLRAVSQDPAMLYWLDNHLNVRGKPNENFAREVMELFTLGIGNYGEHDIQEAARAFTGWTFGIDNGRRVVPARQPGRTAKFINITQNHDDGEKAFLGNKGQFDGEDVLGILSGHPQTARYITKKMWEWFAYPDPEPALIERLAQRWRQNGLEISGLVRDIMTAEEFYSDKAINAIIKCPVDFCVSTARQAGIGEIVKNRMTTQANARGLGLGQALVLSTKAMGMELMYPPDVDGWTSGEGWISTATMVERIKWADAIFGTPTGRAGFRLQATLLLGGDQRPEFAAQRLASIFDARLPKEKMAQLEASAREVSGGRVTRQNANQVAISVCRLIFGSPEFQFV